MSTTMYDIYKQMKSVFYDTRLPRKIKLKSSLAAQIPKIVEDPPKREHIANGVIGQFTGIPIEIDDTIENSYELVY